MTPKEKATDLFNQHYQPIMKHGEQMSEEIVISLLAQKAALITVSEIQNTLTEFGTVTDMLQGMDREFVYWDKVEKEIEAL